MKDKSFYVDFFVVEKIINLKLPLQSEIYVSCTNHIKGVTIILRPIGEIDERDFDINCYNLAQLILEAANSTIDVKEMTVIAQGEVRKYAVCNN